MTSTDSLSSPRARRRRPLAFGLLFLGASAACNNSDNNGGGGNGHENAMTEVVRHWNSVSVDTSGIDHMPTNQGVPHTFGEQLGPCRAARAMAIVHIAVFEAVNAIGQRYQSYVGLAPAQPGTSMRAAIAQAAHDTLVALFPSQVARIDGYLDADLAKVTNVSQRNKGVALGADAAAAILAMRTGDGSEIPEPQYGTDWIPSDQPGHWRQDPISMAGLALGAYWGKVLPFAMTTGDQFRVPPPPDMTSDDYAFAYDEAKILGGDGVITPTIRTEDQTETGIYWAYDGTPSLCAPPRLYNQLTVHIADIMDTNNVYEFTRLLVLVNVAMADAGIAVWDSKYYYDFWRPVTAIRESDPGTGPTGLGDGNDATIGDIAFTPLGAPASNSAGPNFTPPFPTYPSGHAGFGGALFEVLRRYYGRDDIAFTFTSDEFNGVTVDNQGNTRPLLPRSFSSFSEAEEENGQSRIYLGIHWRFDKTESIAEGNQVGDWVYDNFFQPVP